MPHVRSVLHIVPGAQSQLKSPMTGKMQALVAHVSSQIHAGSLSIYSLRAARTWLQHLTDQYTQTSIMGQRAITQACIACLGT